MYIYDCVSNTCLERISISHSIVCTYCVFFLCSSYSVTLILMCIRINILIILVLYSHKDDLPLLYELYIGEVTINILKHE